MLGPLYATIDNVCPECKYGDIDLGLDGDGIWKMSWDFIDCGTFVCAGSVPPDAPTLPPTTHNNTKH